VSERREARAWGLACGFVARHGLGHAVCKSSWCLLFRSSRLSGAQVPQLVARHPALRDATHALSEEQTPLSLPAKAILTRRMSTTRHPPANLHWYLSATRALLKFCRDHSVHDTDEIERCLASLEAGEWSSAVRHATSRKLFGMCSFTDGQIYPAFPHEDTAYVNTVFHALVKEYASAISSLARDTDEKPSAS